MKRTEIIKVVLQLKGNSDKESATVFTKYRSTITGLEYDGFDVYDSWDKGHVAAAKMVVMNHNPDFISVVDDYSVNDFRTVEV